MNAKIAKMVLPAAAVLVLLGTAAAAITLTYTTSSAQSLGVKAAPVQFSVGADGGVSDYVPALAFTTNRTAFTASVVGVPEANVTIGDLVHIANIDTRAHSVTLSTAQIANANINTYKIDWYNGAAYVGTLNFTAASPSVSFSLAAGAIYTAQTTIILAGGAGANNVANAATITMAVSS